MRGTCPPAPDRAPPRPAAHGPVPRPAGGPRSGARSAARRPTRRSASADQGCCRDPGTRSGPRAGSASARTRAAPQRPFLQNGSARRPLPTSRTTARPIVDLPEPLSPTSPRPNGPAASRRLTPSTARTGPNRTLRSVTSSSGGPARAASSSRSVNRQGGALRCGGRGPGAVLRRGNHRPGGALQCGVVAAPGRFLRLGSRLRGVLRRRGSRPGRRPPVRGSPRGRCPPAWAERRRRIPPPTASLAGPRGEPGHRCQQLGREGAGRCRDHLAGRALLDDAAALHDRHPVAQLGDDREGRG